MSWMVRTANLAAIIVTGIVIGAAVCVGVSVLARIGDWIVGW